MMMPVMIRGRSRRPLVTEGALSRDLRQKASFCGLELSPVRQLAGFVRSPETLNNDNLTSGLDSGYLFPASVGIFWIALVQTHTHARTLSGPYVTLALASVTIREYGEMR